MRRQSTVRTAILVFSFLSGLSALLYQILWAREFAVVLGSTTQAISTVLAAFMGGLGLGSLLWGSFVDRSRFHPLRVYAAIEIGIAAAAVFVEAAIQVAPHFYGSLYQFGLPPQVFYTLRFLLTFMIICVPAFFMGGTLPALARLMIRDQDQGATAGWIYGSNAIGAAVGALAAGFYLVERFGLSGTLSVAVSVNIGIALVSWLVSGGSRSGVNWTSERAGAGRPAPQQTALPAGLALYAVSGFVSLGLEVVWSRTLVFSIGSTTYAFSTVLVIVLSGLAIGSCLAAPLLKRFAGAAVDRKIAGKLDCRPLQLLAAGQGLIALLTVSCLWMFDNVAVPMRDWLGYAETMPWPQQILIQFAQSAVLLLPSAILFGAIFPLSADIYVAGSKTGTRVGRLLAANTFAAIAGSLLTGFVFIPALGIQWTYSVLGSAAFLALIYAIREAFTPGIRRVAIAGLAGAWCLILVLPSGRRILEPVRPTEKLLFYKEGINGTISVLEDAAGDRSLLIDHIAVAGTDPIFMTDQKSLAHLPMLLHPNPKRALTVGFGSGGASYSFTRYPQLESVRAVEIDPAVLEAASFFTGTNGDPFSDPRFEVIYDDARSYLLYTRDSYDIITTDCTDLRYKSNALLYTREFFEAARRRLAPNGMVVAWVPLGGLSSNDLKITLQTFSSSFPHSYAWYMYNYPTHYLLAVGTTAELSLDLEQIRSRMAVPAVKQDLAGIGLDDAVKFLSFYLKDRKRLLEFAGDAAVNSDDRPALEFSVPKSSHAFSLSGNLDQFIRDIVDLRDVPQPVLDARDAILQGHVLYNKPGNRYRGALELYRRAQALHPGDGSLPALIRATEQTARDRRREYESLSQLPDAGHQVFNELGLLREDAGDLDGALAAFQRAAGLEPSLAALHMNVGRIFDLKAMADESIAAYKAAIERDPQFGDAWNNLGVVYLERQENEKAYASFQKAVETARESHTAWLNLGLAAFRSEKPERAREAFDRALQLNPKLADAYLNRAILRLAGRDIDGAYADLRSALHERPDYAEAHYNLGIVEEQRRNAPQAAWHYRRAIELNPAHVLAYNNLGIIYSETGQSKLAVETYLKAVAIDQKNPGLRNNLAMEYVRLGHLTEAIAQYRHAIAIQPGMFEPYANLGLIYRRTNQTAEAERYLAEARKLNPNLRIP